MEPESKNKKKERTTPDQLRFYIDFVQNHKQMLSGKNCPTSKMVLEDLWKEVADGLNSMRGPSRDYLKWKESLQLWKNQLRCRARKQKAHIMATGGGPSMSGLSDFEEKALAVLGAEAVSGIVTVNTIGFEENTSVQDTSSSEYITPGLASKDLLDDSCVLIDVDAASSNSVAVDCGPFQVVEEKTNSKNTIGKRLSRSDKHNNTIKKRRIESIYDKVVESIDTRRSNENKLIEGISLMAAAIEKMASSIDNLADCIKKLDSVLQKTCN